MDYTKADWKVGQAVVVSRRGRQGLDTWDGTVTSVGRTWVTVSEEWSRSRFDFAGRGESDTGWRSTLWPSREAFDKHQELVKAWHRLKALVGPRETPPEHLDVADIEALIEKLEPQT